MASSGKHEIGRGRRIRPGRFGGEGDGIRDLARDVGLDRVEREVADAVAFAAAAPWPDPATATDYMFA